MRSALALAARMQLALFLACALWVGQAAAQQGNDFKQVQLTDKQVKAFIAAQKDLSAMSSKLQGSAEKPDPKLQAELDSLAKKHGFANFEELDDIAANISIVMAGLDPETGAFTDPVERIKKEIDEVTADKSIPEKDKKQMLEDLQEELKATPPLRYPANVELVKKYRAEIDEALQ